MRIPFGHGGVLKNNLEKATYGAHYKMWHTKLGRLGYFMHVVNISLASIVPNNALALPISMWARILKITDFIVLNAVWVVSSNFYSQYITFGAVQYTIGCRA